MGLGATTTILFEDAEGNLVPVTVANPLPSTGSGGGGSASWGGITGTLSDQVDLDNALDAKLNVPTTGTASATTYARGDGTWATPPNTTYTPVSQANIENPASTAGGLVTGQRVAQAIAANTIIATLQANMTAVQTEVDTKADAGYEGLAPGVSVAVYWTGTAWPSRPTARTDITVVWTGGTSANPPTEGVVGVDKWEKDVEV